ncbi:Site-specific DNA recombinase SpoIVCA/DNA invertase PinE (SpoIVCA) (PDB:1GDT) [Commensalibacter communis]|uniref:recombinase family protein n=1 Tax=Commensalibacter communis TaxID=2972786 RepID=UPI0022FF67EA|nr:recombinase family protein [Commensalibacter communis]CAI3954114.1 Site-specific DNA recombinase SpoIVCA/DNA invertase PinE (SpoIVCA) (PDB:1GDT) [Commensalibacter communis]CAI3954904.1 Site-specific DNA recombinase SpoIVCA/DNA invertase PinE (SpoIVCA) (PDB:1GDT) [Commensalibacter communis]
MSDIGYIRVSSEYQNTARQLDDVKLDKVFTDKTSGVDTQRPQLQAMLEYVREDDIIHVHSIDRLARNLKDLNELVDNLNAKGISIHFHKENLIFKDDQDPIKKLMFQLLGSFSEFERSLIRERQREGIAKAKQAGKYKGRRKTINSEAIVEAMNKEGASYRKTAKALNISLSTVQRVMKEYKHLTL